MTEKEEAYKIISELVERFSEQLESYKKTTYNETLTRRDFIDPFFKALGWDMDNSQGYAESYREVIHEDKVKIGGATKAPDYSFRLTGSKRLFFVEAKKPSVVVKDDISVAYQIRRYGWSAKLAVSIVTDFEEFAVYDCTKKPFPSDKAATARIKYFTFREYLKEFDFIWETFSKARILKGGLDKFVQSDTQKKGTATVDKEFLESLDNWRKYLATSISLNNKQLGEDEINFAVQQTIDRIIFLRIAEDRSIEPYGTMKVAIKHGNYYHNLFQLFQEADDKYNSGLFDFKKDHICKQLKIDNKVIQTIINELYYPASPYEFSVLSVEILGSAYEQFLGKVIRITPAHNAVIEEKSEVRKAGGVFYTPQYVVDYIVKNTVGKLIEGKAPEEISKIKIVDPACGSGSFLLGAYQYLIDYHKDYYFEKGKPSKGKKDKPLTPDGNLTTAIKKNILLNNIYGVDLDVNAVEVTKLSLLLKCLEGETQASIEQQLQLFKERVLPNLDNNIKSGNSLIDTDFYDGQFEFDDERKIKPFNWHKAFPDVFKIKKSDTKLEFRKQYNKVKNLADETEALINRLSDKVEESQIEYVASAGFDVVIGNPPYVLIEGEFRNDLLLAYYRNKFRSAAYKIDLYHLFIERGLSLLREDGMLGYITPSNYFSNNGLIGLREAILQNSHIEILNNISGKVFSGASVDTAITILSKGQKNQMKSKFIHSIWKEGKFNEVKTNEFYQNVFNDNEGKIFISTNSKVKYRVKTFELGEQYNVKFGMQLRDRKKYESDVITNEKKKFITKYHRPCYTGKDVKKWIMNYSNLLAFFNREAKSGGCWDETIHNANPKIIVRQIGETPVCAIDENGFCCLNTVFMIVPKSKTEYNLKFILALLNSNLISYYWKNNYSDLRQTFPKIKGSYLEKLPIPYIEFMNQKSKMEHDEIVKFVDHLLQLYKEKQNVILQSACEQLEGKIEYCEEKINQMIYELYGLTQDEIKIIEGK